MTETSQLFAKQITKPLSFFMLSLLHILLLFPKSSVRNLQIIEIIVGTAVLRNQSPLMAFNFRNLGISNNKLGSQLCVRLF
jgi:hypothetical protein